MPAVLFGSISTIADTSELQRASFNEAFAQHGLDWTWEREEYATSLRSNGGAQRIADYADARGEKVDAQAVHGAKSRIFQEKLASSGISPRTGVVETVGAAKNAGYAIALVTTTSPENVSALFAALGDALPATMFDLVVDLTQVDEPKPSPAAYRFALDKLGEQADSCVAIEDNLGGVQSAVNAGLACIAFPNANTTGHGFEEASRVVDHIDFADVSALAEHA